MVQRTWLENRQTSIRVPEHQLALLGGMPPEKTDIREEGVGFFMHCDPGVRAPVDPDVQRTPLGHERHSIS